MYIIHVTYTVFFAFASRYFAKQTEKSNHNLLKSMKWLPADGLPL
jgi:hypothetical protein